MHASRSALDHLVDVAEGWELERVTTPSRLFGANGLRTGPDGRVYIAQVTGSQTAWQQVQSIGYWVNVVIQPYIVDGVTEYKAVYTLIYSKDDDIRLIQGSDILI